MRSRPRHFPRHFPQGKTLNFGHRGGSLLAPENTLYAFQEAIDAGADGVEFDVMLCGDGCPVVFHDYTLQERLFFQGQVRQMGWSQLRKLDVSAYYAEAHKSKASIPQRFRPARIPSLEEAFCFFQEHPHVLLNIELKNEDPYDAGQEQEIARWIRLFGYQHRVMVSSFNPFAIWRFGRIMAEVPRALIFSEENPIYIRQLWFLHLAKPDALHPRHSLVDRAFLEQARRRGYVVNPWTVNDDAQMRRLLALGVNGIITDAPDRLAQVMAERP